MTLYEIKLKKTGSHNDQTTEVINALNDCGLTYASCLLESTPATLVDGLSRQDAEYIYDLLFLLGNEVEIKKVSAKNTQPRTISQQAVCDAARIERDSFENLRKDSMMKKEHRTGKASGGAAPGSTEAERILPGGKTGKQNNPSNNNSGSARKNRKAARNGQISGSSQTSRNSQTAKKKSSSSSGRRPHKSAVARADLWVKAITVVAVLFILVGVFAPVILKAIQKGKPEDRRPVIPVTTPATDKKGYTGTEKKDPVIKISEKSVIGEFVQRAFGKDVSEVTQEDMDRVVSIIYNQMEDGRPVFQYELTDGTADSFVTTRGSFDSDELSACRNLQVLDSDYMSLDRGSLCNLEHLHTLGAKGSFFPSLNACVNPATITSLRISMSITSEVRFGEFVNLEELTVNCSFHAALGDLGNLPHLKKLHIMNGDYMEEFEGITKLTELEELYIDAEVVKSIKFIEYMPNLRSFGIEGSRVQDISSLLAFKDQMQELYLVENASIRDYSVVKEMTQLEKLAVVTYGSSGVDDILSLPDTEYLQNLTWLRIGGFDNCDELAKAENLECLTVERNYDSKLSGVRELEKLKEYHQHGGSVYTEQVENLLSCELLETVCFESAYMWTDLSTVLNLKGLKKLELYRATSGFDPEKVEGNPTLEYLNMSSLTLRRLKEDGSWDYMETDYITLDEVEPMFQGLPALKYLVLPECGIEDLEFLRECKNLEILHMEHNYVTDLSPLKDLPMVLIYCKDNPVYETAGLDDIMVK